MRSLYFYFDHPKAGPLMKMLISLELMTVQQYIYVLYGDV